ncbi:MAG: gamma-glutamyltransferase, partial [Pseudomonadales bacterium]
MHQQYGTQEWPALFSRAIQLAEEGFVISPQLSEFIMMSASDFSAYTNAFYTKDGVPLVSGDTLVQRDLAKSFKRIAKGGASVFYDGEIADAIEQVMVEREGFLRKVDLQQDTAEWWDPIVYDYKGYQVYTASVPS